jgi:hypothetical protein
VTVALPETEVFAWLVAVIVTVCCDVIGVGAVYTPPEVIDPAPLGLTDQFTAVLLVLMTVAANVSVWPA